jgi:hypothetical protein
MYDDEDELQSEIEAQQASTRSQQREPNPEWLVQRN